MALFAPWGNQQFFDDNGNPATGWKIYSYAAGSSTPLATYTTSAESVAQSNPIILDPLGFPTVGQIWLTSGIAYKLVLTNAAGVVKKTEDNIIGVTGTASVSQWQASGLTPTYVSATSFTLAGDQTSAFHLQRRLQSTTTAGTIYSTITATAYTTLTTVTVVNDAGVLDSGLSAVNLGLLTAVNPSVPASYATTASLAASSAASLVGYLPAGTGAVATTVQTKLRESVSITDYGNNIVTAIAAIGATLVELLIPNAVTLTGNTNIPNNIAVRVTPSGFIDNAGFTLKINGPFSSGLSQCFKGAGQVSFANAVCPEFYPQWWGAKGDGKTVTDGAMTAASGVLTSASAVFTAADVGKYVTVNDAGAAGVGDVLYGTISSYQSATQVTLSVAATATVTTKSVTYGTDDTAAFNTAITSVSTNLSQVAIQGYNGTPGLPVLSQGATLRVPSNTYIILGTIRITKSNITIAGEGRGNTRLFAGGQASVIDALIKFVGASVTTTGQTRMNVLSDMMLYTANALSVRRRYGFIEDFGEHFHGENLFFFNFGYSAITLLTAFEGTWNNIYIQGCGSDQPAAEGFTGVISFDSSTIYPGQCNNTLFTRLALSSNYGTEININGSSQTHTNINFDGVYHETSPSDAGAVSNKDHIFISNAANISFNNFAFVFSTETAHTASAVQVNYSLNTKNIVFSNGFFNINVASAASPSMLARLVRTQSPLIFENVAVWDRYGIVLGGLFQSNVATYASFVLDSVTIEAPYNLTQNIQGSGPVWGRVFLTDVLGANTQSRYYFTKADIVLSASLASGSAAMNGTVVIEDAGTGAANMIIYKGGQRFRVTAGAAF